VTVVAGVAGYGVCCRREEVKQMRRVWRVASEGGTGCARRGFGSGVLVLGPGVFFEGVNQVLVRPWAFRPALWGS
jgi:hypothetical protein